MPKKSIVTNTEAETVGIVNTWYEESRDWRMPMFDKMVRLYEKFRNYLELDETYLWNSRIFIPEFFSIAMTAMPQIMETLLGTSPYVHIEPLRPDTVAGSKYAEKILENQLDRLGVDNQGLYTLMYRIWLDTIIYGDAFFDIRWRYEEGTQRKREAIFNDEPELVSEILDPNTGQPLVAPPGTVFKGYAEVEREAVVFDGPEIVPLSWKDVYPDPYGTTVQAPSRYIITRQLLTEAEVEGLKDEDERGEQNFFNLSEIKYSASRVMEDDPDNRKDVDEITGIPHSSSHGKYTEFLTCQYSKRVKGSWVEWKSIISDRGLLVFDSRNPYYHNKRSVIKAGCVPLNDRFYSIGLLEPAEDLQDGLNQRYNQQADIITMVLNPMYKVTQGAYDRLYDLYQGNIPSTPGLMLPVGINQDIAPVTQFSQIRPAQEDLGYLQNKMESVTGAYQHIRGGLPQRKETATTVVQTQANASLRMKVLLKILWYTSLRPIADTFLQLNHQFKDDREMIKFTDKQGMTEFVTVSKEDIPYDGMAFKPNSIFIDPTIAKELQAQKFQQLALEMSQTPLGNYLNWRELGNILFDLRDIKANDGLLKTEQQVQQEQQQLALQEAELQG
jgi:hypothetical protein